MDIRKAINKAGFPGRIRLGKKVFDVVCEDGGIPLADGEGESYIFTVKELTSLEWEYQSTEWKSYEDE